MNDLLQTMAVAGGPGAQWAGSIENLDGAEAGDGGMAVSSRRSGQRMKELALSTNAIDCAALTLPTAGHSRAKLRLQVKGQGANRWWCSYEVDENVSAVASPSSVSQQVMPPARTLLAPQMTRRVKVRT